MHTSLMLSRRHTNTCIHTVTKTSVDIKVLMSLGFFYCFTLYNLNSNMRQVDLWRLRVWVCVLTNFSVLKTSICTVEIQGCVSEIQFPYMQFGFLLILGVFCTFIHGIHTKNHARAETAEYKLSRSPKHSRQITAYLWNMHTEYKQHYRSLYVLSTTELM